MVESIYGRRRAANPQLKHDQFYFSLGLPHHRKASGEPPNLRTIAETDDDTALCSAVNTTFLRAQRQDTSNTDHKPRAISLPLPRVYRDGSYLRINITGNSIPERTRRRRFSEPAVAWSRPLQTDFSFDKSDGESHECSILPSTPRISFAEEKGCSTRNFDLEKRRHSDPLLYNNCRGDNVTCVVPSTLSSHQKQTTVPYHDNLLTRRSDESTTPDSVSVESVEKVAIEPKEATHSRRRKSSLVPIPFGVNKTTSRTRRKTSSRRRFSFPLTKNEQELTRNLQEIEPDRLFERYTSENTVSKIKGHCEYIDVKCSDDFSAIPKEELVEENKTSCNRIITQWMKFFG